MKLGSPFAFRSAEQIQRARDFASEERERKARERIVEAQQRAEAKAFGDDVLGRQQDLNQTRGMLGGLFKGAQANDTALRNQDLTAGREAAGQYLAGVQEHGRRISDLNSAREQTLTRLEQVVAPAPNFMSDTISLPERRDRDFGNAVREEVPLLAGPNLGDTPGPGAEVITSMQANRLLARAHKGEFGDPFSPENIELKDYLTTIVEGAPASVTPAGFGEGKNTSLRELLSPVVPQEAFDPIRKVPVFGDATADIAAGLTSPLSIMSLGVGTAGAGAANVAKGLVAPSVGSVALGSAGYALEDAGVPTASTPVGPIGPAAVGEGLGGLGTVRNALGQGLLGFARRGSTIPKPSIFERIRTGTSTEQGFIRDPNIAAPPTMPAPLQSFFTKMGAAFKKYEGERPMVESARSAERAARLAEQENLIQQGIRDGLTPDEAYAQSQSALKGKYPDFQEVPDFTPTPEEANSFWQRLVEHPLGWERERAWKAINKWKSGDPAGLQPNEIKLLRKMYGDEFGDILTRSRQAARGQHGIGWKILQTGIESLKLPQELATSFDLSWMMNQGGKFMWRSPKEWWRGGKDAFKALINEDNALEIDTNWRTDKTPIEIEFEGGTRTVTLGDILDGKIPGFTSDVMTPFPGQAASGSAMDVYSTSAGANLPGVSQSGRAFVTAGNSARAAKLRTFLLNDMRQGRPITKQSIEAYSNVLNRSTGRGTFRVPGQGPNQIEGLLRQVAWAPGFRASGPQLFLQMFNVKNPQAARFAAESLASWAAGNMALLGAAALMGAAVETRPNSRDFGKITVGDTHYNIWGSDQVLARSIVQSASQSRYNDATGTSETDWKAPLTMYLRSGADPVVGGIIDLMQGENLIGEEASLATPEKAFDFFVRRAVPLGLQDINDIIAEDGPFQAALSAPAIFLGGRASAFETPTERTANAYNDRVEAGEFGPEAKVYKEEDPAVRSQFLNANPEIKGEPGETAQNLTGAQVELEEKYDLPVLANGVINQTPGAGEKFVDAYEQFSDAASGAAADAYFSLPDRDPKGDIGQKYQAWVDIKSNDYRTPDLEIDWDEYFTDKDAAFAALPMELQEIIEGKLKTRHGIVPRIEERFKEARSLRSELYDQSKWEDLSPEKSQELIKFQRLVTTETQRLKREAELSGRDPDDVTEKKVAIALGRSNAQYDEIAALAVLDYAGDLDLNRERIQFALDNQSLLSVFFPTDFKNALPAKVERSSLVTPEAFAQINR